MKIIYFLSFLFISNLIICQNGKNLFIDASYAIDENSYWKNNPPKQQTYTPFGKTQHLNIGYNKNTTVWCKFKITNRDSLHSKQSWLTFDNNRIDSLVLFDGEKQLILGDRTRFESPFMSTLAFEINLKPKQKKTLFVKVKKEISYFYFTYKFENEEKLITQSNIKLGIVSFVLGFISVLLLYNAILYYITKKRIYGYYILNSSLTLIYILISTNYAKHLLFKEFLYFSEARIYISSLSFITLSVFLAHFLNLKKLQPKKYTIIKILNYINVFIIVITIIFLVLKKIDLLKLFSLFGYINFVLTMGWVLWVALIHLSIHKKSAIYVLISFTPQLIWGLALILKSFQLISNDFNVDTLAVIGLYEALFFGYILTKNYIETFQKNNELIYKISVEKEKSIKSITQAQIRERRNISNIIHDNFGSKIAYISHLIQLEKIALADKNIKELAVEIRNISHQILPKSLDDGALISSIKSQIEILQNGFTNTTIELFHYDFPEKIEEPWIYDMYLISLEIINNALKHGKATSIQIELYGYDDCYHFQFIDNGVGLNSNEINKGFGLDTIEKRVLYYKGTFEISSVLEQGTTVQISIPK